MAISIVVYEVLAAIFTVFRGWQALRIRVDITSGMNRLQYLVVQQGEYWCFWHQVNFLMVFFNQQESFISGKQFYDSLVADK